MLVTQIEIWPFGDEDESRGIAMLKIANLGTRVETEGKHRGVDKADYACVLEMMDKEVWCYVRDFRRNRGALALVRAALEGFKDA
jgi:hypothetical protein